MQLYINRISFLLLTTPYGMDAILFGHDKQKIEQGESWSVLDLFEHSYSM